MGKAASKLRRRGNKSFPVEVVGTNELAPRCYDDEDQLPTCGVMVEVLDAVTVDDYTIPTVPAQMTPTLISPGTENDKWQEHRKCSTLPETETVPEEPVPTDSSAMYSLSWPEVSSTEWASTNGNATPKRSITTDRQDRFEGTFAQPPSLYQADREGMHSLENAAILNRSRVDCDDQLVKLEEEFSLHMQMEDKLSSISDDSDTASDYDYGCGSLGTFDSQNAYDLNPSTNLAKVRVQKIGFPVQYKYLLKEKKITGSTLKKFKRLSNLIMNQQSTAKGVIDRQEAIVCLNWAHAMIECRHPIATATLSRGASRRGLFTVKLLKSCNEYTRLTNLRVLDVRCNQQHLFHGFVVSVEKKCIMLRADCSGNIARLRISLPERVELHESMILSNFVPSSTIRSLVGLRDPALQNIVAPQPEVEVSLSVLTSDFSYENYINYIMQNGYGQELGLNMEQTMAMLSIERKLHMPYPFVLFGPPGTGKTHTIATIVDNIMHARSDDRVLICTPSNMAADGIAKKLMRIGYRNSNEFIMLRMYSPRVEFDHRDTELDPVSAINKHGKCYRIPAIKELRTMRIIICTLASSSHLISRGVPRSFFSHIIIDEAGQAHEGDISIPIGGLATSNTQVILCGDPRQLGPVVTLDLSDEIKAMITSPLVRLTNIPAYSTSPRLCVQLRKCFRCDPAIVSIVSRMFYENSLIAKSIEGEENMHDWEGLPTRGFPMVFFDVPNAVEIKVGFSTSNSEEAQVVAKLAQALIRDNSIAPTDIGIIAPYKGQCCTVAQSLRDVLGKDDSDAVTVGSVERFQGSERKVIIMTCTRTNFLGFMTCKLRLNTSVSRAQQLLCIVGNSRALTMNESWAEMIRYFHENGGFTEWPADQRLPLRSEAALRASLQTPSV